MNLYGQDMDEATQPLESGLAWTIAWGDTPDRAFIGRTALENARARGSRNILGLVLEAPGVMRPPPTVRFANRATGATTPGGVAPRRQTTIDHARVANTPA